MTQQLEILEQMKIALDDAYAAGVRNSQRTWVGLTDDEIKEASLKAGMQEHYMGFHSGFIRFAQTIEAKLKQKNGYAEEKNT